MAEAQSSMPQWPPGRRHGCCVLHKPHPPPHLAPSIERFHLSSSQARYIVISRDSSAILSTTASGLTPAQRSVSRKGRIWLAMEKRLAWRRLKRGRRRRRCRMLDKPRDALIGVCDLTQMRRSMFSPIVCPGIHDVFASLPSPRVSPAASSGKPSEIFCCDPSWHAPARRDEALRVLPINPTRPLHHLVGLDGIACFQMAGISAARFS